MIYLLFMGLLQFAICTQQMVWKSLTNDIMSLIGGVFLAKPHGHYIARFFFDLLNKSKEFDFNDFSECGSNSNMDLTIKTGSITFDSLDQ